MTVISAVSPSILFYSIKLILSRASQTRDFTMSAGQVIAAVLAKRTRSLRSLSGVDYDGSSVSIQRCAIRQVSTMHINRY